MNCDNTGYGEKEDPCKLTIKNIKIGQMVQVSSPDKDYHCKIGEVTNFDQKRKMSNKIDVYFKDLKEPLGQCKSFDISQLVLIEDVTTEFDQVMNNLKYLDCRLSDCSKRIAENDVNYSRRHGELLKLLTDMRDNEICSLDETLDKVTDYLAHIHRSLNARLDRNEMRFSNFIADSSFRQPGVFSRILPWFFVAGIAVLLWLK